MSGLDAFAMVLKGFLLGGLGGLVLPTIWMAIVFGSPGFFRQFTDGTSLPVILTSVISIPFSTMFRGLIEGGLVQTIVFGAVSGAAVAIVALLLRRFLERRWVAVVCSIMALAVGAALVYTQSSEITLATGLFGAQIWVLVLMYVAMIAWLGYTLPQRTAA
jgi:hypothetical protein